MCLLQFVHLNIRTQLWWLRDLPPGYSPVFHPAGIRGVTTETKWDRVQPSIPGNTPTTLSAPSDSRMANNRTPMSQLRDIPQQVANAPVAASNWYPTLTCGSSKLVIPAVTPRAAATTGGINQVRLSGVVCPFPSLVLPVPPILFPAHSHPNPTTPSPLALLSSSLSLSLLTLSCFPSVDNVLRRGRHTITNNSSPNPHPPYTPGYPWTARVILLTLAAWNVRSLLDNPRSNQPERRTALVARELAHYKVDIAAVSETRFSEQGQLEEVGADYTF
ncbi:unnamed protein product [Schistocephalus solidus]|uniref:Endo/exonuclease/phosphatase domain-containing protein n=1 Tax=Schistocephalus solidus TaxID=70667 RepID=A0A183T0X5_SCHSO|nr:unnamed protein product [Schistocephalus solidus]